jgi:hypothetical protein
MSETTEARDHLIQKRGYYYRPNRAGYTMEVSAAGRYTKTDAEREAQIEPWQIKAVPLASLPPIERDAKDYAIEFGGYLAASAERFMVVVNQCNGDLTGDEPSDAWQALQSAIYEFRKRADRASRLPCATERIADKGRCVMTDLPQSADTLEDARTLALHYQQAAAKCGQHAMRMRFALLILREWSIKHWSSNITMTVQEWIDAGMSGPIPWPGGAFFEEWAEEQGWTNIDGFIGIRVTAKLIR